MDHALTTAQARERSCCAYNQNCQAAACMAWRWERVMDTEQTAQQQPSGRYSLVRAPVYKKTDRGYCGLVKE